MNLLTLSVLPHALQEVQTARDDDDVAQVRQTKHNGSSSKEKTVLKCNQLKRKRAVIRAGLLR